MLKKKEYCYLLMSAVICCTLQYYLLVGSHQRGIMHWPYVFPISLLAFFIANQLYKRGGANTVRRVLIVISMLFVPFLVYTLSELTYFPAALFNTIRRGEVFFYVWTVTLFSAGWLFSIALLLNARYRKTLARETHAMAKH